MTLSRSAHVSSPTRSPFWQSWIPACLRTSAASRARSRRPERRSSDAGQVELLEQRVLLSATTRMAGGRIVVLGTAGADQINVQLNASNPQLVQVVVNGSVLAERDLRTLRGVLVDSGAGDDVITVNVPPELSRFLVTVNAGAGNDRVTIESGRATVRGGEGNDVLIGGAGLQRIYGGGGDDLLEGGDGDDLLLGDTGVDTLRGGDGSNQLNGGKGADWIYLDATDSYKVDTADVLIDLTDKGLQRLGSDAEFEQWLLHFQTEQYQRNGTYWNTSAWLKGSMALDSVGTTGSPQHSETNTQEAGVDEQDIVETDGEYIYLVRGNELLIVDALPAEEANIVSRTTLSGWGAQMYLSGTKLTIISQVYDYYLEDIDQQPVLDVEPTTDLVASRMSIWPGFWYYKPQIQITTYDISDRAAPTVVESTKLDGSLVSSRGIDGRTYLVVSNQLQFWGPFDPWGPIIAQTDTPVVSSKLAQSRETEWSVDQIVPQYTTTTYVDGVAQTTSGAMVSGADIWVPKNPWEGANLLSVLMFDTSDGTAGIDDTSTLAGVSGEVYASEDALYIASQNWDNWRWNDTDLGPQTDLYKFSLDEEGSEYAAAGSVSGRIVNQYAMDEADGNFRIATTSGGWGDGQTNGLYILQQQESKLTVVAGVTGLAPGQSIYSARFVGDRAYMSTFRQVDPLYTIDLSDPLNPIVLGELHIPGFSTYLHPWGDNYLIGIGQDADPETGRTTGLQLSLFDVSGDEAVLVDTYKLTSGEWGTWSEAQWDPHAFSFFAEQGILAIPTSSWQDSGYESHLDVFTLDAENGFTLLGEIIHGSSVRRSLRIGDNLISISDDDLQIVPLNDPNEVIAHVEFGPQQDPFPYPIILW